MSELIQPTEAEKLNGWTAETLTAYIKKQAQSQHERVFSAKPKPRPRMQNSQYNPFRWRK